MPFVENMLRDERFKLTVCKPRRTKLGDFRPPHKGELARITINNNLHPAQFLLTLTHEIAHLKTDRIFGSKVMPHGVEWQRVFSDLMQPILSAKLFPADIQLALEKHMKQPKAACGSDIHLSRILNKHAGKDQLTLESLPEGSYFALQNRRFKKGPKLRKRYKCLDVDNGKSYMVHALAPVQKLEIQRTA